MGKNGLTMLFAVLLIAGVTAGNAYSGGKGGHDEGDGFGKGGHHEGSSFEAPFVDLSLTPPAQVVGSEGELKADGSFEVEIPGVPAGSYKICLESTSGPMFLTTVTLGTTGELKAEGTVPAVGTFIAPNFRIFTTDMPATDTACSVTEKFRSGLTVM